MEVKQFVICNFLATPGHCFDYRCAKFRTQDSGLEKANNCGTKFVVGAFVDATKVSFGRLV